MRYLLFLCLLVTTILHAQTNKYTGCADGTETPAVTNLVLEIDVFERVNGLRAVIGVPPLKRVSEFTNSARYHAKDMGDDNYFEHHSYDRVSGNLSFVCSTFTRVGMFYDWSTDIAENIGSGTDDPATMMDNWINSPGHYTNMTNVKHWEFGIGYYFNSSSDQQHYWCQNFGIRTDVYPLVINYDSSVTSTTKVRLYIYGTGVFSEMRLKNDLGSWGSWQAFQANLSWTLTNSQGDRKVHVELRNVGTGASSSNSDVINYNIWAGVKALVSNQYQSTIGPNPFRGITNLSLYLSRDQQVQIDLFSLSGQRLKEIHKGELRAGTHRFEIIPMGTSRILICRIRGEQFTHVKKLVLID